MISGTWEPTKVDIDGLEANLHMISEMSKKGKSPWMRIEHPERQFRQYLGIMQSGQRLIYVNAFCGLNGDQPPQNWKNHLVTISDGGSCVWRSIYDPFSKKFLELSINGLA